MHRAGFVGTSRLLGINSRVPVRNFARRRELSEYVADVVQYQLCRAARARLIGHYPCATQFLHACCTC